MSDPVIVLDNVRKEFGEYVAVEAADFSIRRGEFFSLLGPSGCGKTTILKMIAGFERPTSGAILLEGDDVSSVPPHQRHVNTVFQAYALFPHMSVLDNVAFGLRAKKVPPAEARKRAVEMLDIVRLGEFVKRRPGQLSGGQQQRVALARALVNRPSALLLDEPLAALDLKLREAMQIELKRIQRELAITFVFVTHDQGEALTMSDRIAVMSKGNVEQIGTPEEIYDKPSSIFVAGFIGSANLLPGRVSSAEGTGRVDLALGATIDVPGLNGAEQGDDVTVMVRPERLVPTVGAPPAGRSVVGEIKEVIYQGSELRLIVDLDNSTEVIVVVEPDDATPNTKAGKLVTLEWASGAPFVMRGRTEIVGATTTDFEEVEATMSGADLDGVTAEVDGSGSGFGRRALLTGAGLAGAAVIVGGVLKLTGDGSSVATVDTAGASGGVGTGDSQLRVLNWQEYIDPSEDGMIGTIDRFQEASGIAVTYSEDFNDNNEVYARELEPLLGTGNVVPYDIVCPTNWLAARLRGQGWIEPLPLDRIPNRVNLEERFLTAPWDYGAAYHLPWQGGITGLAYNPALTGRPLTSINDLFDPAFAGKIGMLTEMRDTVGLVMLAMGADPSVVDVDGMRAAIAKIDQAKRGGQIRAFTGNDYLQSLENGNFVACMAWSGDIVQLQYDRPDIEFVIPDDGGISWYDTMVIPKGAANAYAAADFMNFVYDPVQAAQMTYWVQYISPVKGVREELIKMGGDAAELADSPILFPDAATAERLFTFAPLPQDVDIEITEAFLNMTGA